ncbi:CDP-alcohol phosphatidyltransferase family protein [Cellulomonas sp. ATA003]|uniref:CDP-alcohol phosphatidyltransferase family protein n=1 Tax=Cellulomonas sp. ATA003 TaxID=3073064 RepID=UPI002873BABF|nr:CDP-alcohol phosphatidyltransferase family protein [Cellulomonas sp. ATA003]WNB85077.1 CDP-alcohol phosphatidyltransferase family protein [Cellulomonas sp. ATA003]
MTSTAGPDTPETYLCTVRRLAAAQKPAARSAPAYSRYVNRRIGRYLAAWAFRAGLSPNAVTGISALFTFTGVALLMAVPPSSWSGVTIALLLLVGYAFDSADGQVSRLRGGGTPAGEWLDHMVDAAKVSAMPLAVLVGFARFDAAPEGWLLVPLSFSVVSAVLFFGMILTEQLRRQHGQQSLAVDAPGRPSWLRALLVAPMDYGLLCLSFVLLGATDVFMVVYTVLFAATTAFTVLASVKWFREMRSFTVRAAPAASVPSGGDAGRRR